MDFEETNLKHRLPVTPGIVPQHHRNHGPPEAWPMLHGLQAARSPVPAAPGAHSIPTEWKVEDTAYRTALVPKTVAQVRWWMQRLFFVVVPVKLGCFLSVPMFRLA